MLMSPAAKVFESGRTLPGHLKAIKVHLTTEARCTGFRPWKEVTPRAARCGFCGLGTGAISYKKALGGLKPKLGCYTTPSNAPHHHQHPHLLGAVADLCGLGRLWAGEGLEAPLARITMLFGESELLDWP